TEEARDYDIVKTEILTQCGQSPLNAAGDFYRWKYNLAANPQAQMDDLHRIARHWLQPDQLLAKEVNERVVMDWFLRGLPDEERRAGDLQGPLSTKEFLEGHSGDWPQNTTVRDSQQPLELPPRGDLPGDRKPECGRPAWLRRTEELSPPPQPSSCTWFEMVGMDLVGLIPKSARGHEYILVILDYATQYPEAVPLQKATSWNISWEFLAHFSQVAIPKTYSRTKACTSFIPFRQGLEDCWMWPAKHGRANTLLSVQDMQAKIEWGPKNTWKQPSTTNGGSTTIPLSFRNSIPEIR
ncbi:hypothetical protein QTP70_025545, partial [Hemibagrus guttatus]